MTLRGILGKIPASCFNLLFPETCRVCDDVLTDATRVPVCRACLAAPAPMLADYYCSMCHTPYLSNAPLDERSICRRCRLGLSGYDAAYSYGFYDGTLRELVHLFKYGRVATLSKPLSEFLLRALPDGRRFDVIVPVPLHWTRRFWRGFNQAELLARPLESRLHIPMVHALGRARRTAVQASLALSSRRSNVAGAFVLRRPNAVREKRVLLVDDVLTTGATAGICAALLRGSGARSVTVLTLARVDRRPGIAFSNVMPVTSSAGVS